jgi:probable F420-dependent oxidoreductase
MEYGLQLGTLDWQRLKDVAQAAEQLGFRSLMLPDHFFYEGPERMPAAEFYSYDALIRAAVLVEATKTVEIGHLVLCNLFRHPAMTAQALMSLDTLSGGRIFAGLGSGWTEREFEMTGMPFPDIGARLRMLDEALTVLRSLFTQHTTTFSGEFYQLRDAVLNPKPVRKPYPPILLGGGGRGLLRLAGKHADVVNIISETGKAGYIKVDEVSKLTDAVFQEKVRFVRAEAARHGRNPRDIRISNVAFTTMITDSPEATRMSSEALAGFFRIPPEALPRSPMALIGTPDELIAEIKRRTEAWELGQIVFVFTDETTMRRLAEEVLPHV